ncbi:MAG: cytochrome c biogenesis protein CcsA [Syntrophomonadaceae bacterium]|nr:cytochrome c biogenesis protein CcsA [Syntrophomonadaceae bacterium]
MILFIQLFLYLSLLLYTLAAISYFVGQQNVIFSNAAFKISAIGFVVNLLALIMRILYTGRLPLVNGSEFILSFAGFTVLIYLWYEVKSKVNSAGGVVMGIAVILIASIIILMPNQLLETHPLMPALKSPWLTSHVLTAVFAYAGFAVAAGLAAIELLKNKETKGNSWIYKINSFSFAMLTLTIVLGAIWAEQAWGRYWSWDPKETWAGVTWIIYALYFHLHKSRKWQGKRANIMVLAGFILVLFTFFGVNYLILGLHSYA